MDWILNFFDAVNSQIIVMAPLLLLFFFLLLLLHNINLGLALLIFSIPLSPELTGIFGPQIPIRIDDILILMLFIVWAMRVGKGEANIYRTPFTVPIIIFFSFMIFSTVVGYAYKHTITNVKYSVLVLLKNFEYYAIFFLVANNMHTRKQIRSSMALWMLAYFFVILYGIVEYIFTHPLRLYDTSILYTSQTNHMSGYLMISTSIALMFFLAIKRKREKLMYLMLLILSFYPFFYNKSKQGYLSFAVSIFLAYLIFRPRLLLIPILTIFILFFGIPHMFPQLEEVKSIEVVKQDILKMDKMNIRNPTSADVRRRAIARSFQILPKNPFIGCGTGYRPLAYYDSQIPLLLLEDGIIGTGIFLWLLFTILINGLRIFFASRDAYFKAISAAFIASFFGVLVHSVASTAWMVTLIIEPFWFLAGIIVAIDRINRKEAVLEVEPFR